MPSIKALLNCLLYFTGFNPADSFDEAVADMISDGVVDVRNAVIKFHFESDEVKKVLNWSITNI